MNMWEREHPVKADYAVVTDKLEELHEEVCNVASSVSSQLAWLVFINALTAVAVVVLGTLLVTG